ncbi:MAG: rhodanese-like domain-containing protein [Candidatus Marinimicrobia bacterium]|nr:rhodanese-like domain-containing protein [Candidatus Neomarinimicrobiota bacterium]
MSTQPYIGFRQLFDQDTSTFTYLLWDLDTREGVIIDPVREQFERDLCLVGELGVRMVYALDTHVHADHVTSLGMLREEMRLQTAVGEPSGVPCADIMLNDGYTLGFGRHTLTALATPGHTDACTSFKVENMVFTGDTLLIRGCGRTDFQQGDPEMLYRSITQKIYTLPDETLVYPGHDYNGKSVSTIGEEKQYNPRIPSTQTESDFAELMNSLNLPRPKHIDEAVPANMGCGISVDHGHLTEEVFGVRDLQKILTALSEDEVVIDCRTPDEYEAGHIPGAINLPMGKELDQLGELRVYRKIYLYCYSGRRSQTVFATLTSKGLDNLVCLGSSGMAEWKKFGYPVER